MAPAPGLLDFGARVRARRVELELTQEQLADVAGLHWTYIGQIERGRRNLTLRNVLVIAQALELAPGELLDGLEPW